jgi:Ala-tRNA(Pro) deacylase
MEGIPQRIVLYLEAARVPFEKINHPSAGSAEEYRQTMGTRLEQQAKALFLRIKNKNSKGFAIAAIQAQKKADLKLLAHLLRVLEIRLGTKEQLEQITACTYGELPPLGRIFSVPLIMDKDLLSEENIYFNAGSLTFSIVMSPSDLMRLEEPILF